MTVRLELLSPDGVPEVAHGDDLAALVAAAVALQDRDVVVVTSKVVSKAEGLVHEVGADGLDAERDRLLTEETVRVVARRGATRIVRTRHGLTLAAAGIDASNVGTGRIALLPRDPDASARSLRARLRDLTGANVGVVVTDTAGRAWRDGQVDLAIGAAGVLVAEDFAGRVDPHGHELAVTRPAVADEVAAAAELAAGKLGGRPFAVLRGRPDLVLPPDADGAGAQALVRREADDLFGYGAREAVVRALAGDAEDRAGFGAPTDLGELVEAVARVGRGGWRAVVPGEVPRGDRGSVGHPAPATYSLDLEGVFTRTAVEAVCFAHGWRLESWDAGPEATLATVSQHSPTSTP